MSRFPGLTHATARERGELRLAQLSDDNAFVDVEAVLGASAGLATRGGAETAGSSSGAAGTARRTPGGARARAAGPTAATTAASGPDHGASEGFLDATDVDGTARASSAPAAALLASRVALSASLAEQHKSYLRHTESIKKSILQVQKTADEDTDEDGDDADADAEDDGNEVTEEPADKTPARRAGLKRQRGTDENEKPKASSQSVRAQSASHTTTPIPATSLLASWSGRQPLATRPPTSLPAPSSSSSPSCASSLSVCGSTTSDVLHAARRELVLLEQWKRWMLSPPLESELHRLAQSHKRGDSHALLVPCWDAHACLPWPVMAHWCLTCPSHRALAAAPVQRVPPASAHASPLPSAATERPLTAPELREAEALAWLGLGPSPRLHDGCDGAAQNHLCAVCLLPAAYRCVRCKTALVCSIDCHVVHDATRCLKFLA